MLGRPLRNARPSAIAQLVMLGLNTAWSVVMGHCTVKNPKKNGTRSGSGAHGWHLNVCYSPFFNGFGCFPPVLPSAGGGQSGTPCWNERASVGRPRAGGGGGGGSVFHQFPRGTLLWHAFCVNSCRDANRRTRKVGPDATDGLRE
eukprot:gene7993-biopygen4599